MNILSLYGFFDELEKTATGAFGHGVELAGLGVLAKPSIDRLRKKEVDEHKAAKHEVAGLGILAAPSALHLAHSAYKKMRGIPKVASIPNPAALRGRAGVLTKNITKSVATAPPAKPKFDLAALKAAYDKQGLKPGLGSVARPSLQLKKTSGIMTPYRPAVGSLKATALDAARKAALPTPPAAARARLVNATPERRDLLAHFTAMAGGGKARVPLGKPAIELPAAPSGPMIITR